MKNKKMLAAWMLLMAVLTAGCGSQTNTPAPASTGASATKEAEAPPEEEEEEEPVSMVSYDYGASGFAVAYADSFAAGIEGLYRVEAPDANPEGLEEYAEIYNIYGNLAIAYSGYAYACCELFPAEDESFTQAGAEITNVGALCFSSFSAFGKYRKPFPDGWMLTFTEDGFEITESDGEGETCFIEGTRFVRLDDEMGHLESFDYKNEANREVLAGSENLTHKDLPADLYGIFEVTDGDEKGLIMELTPEGLVQIYRKQEQTEVMVYRGSFVAEKDEVNGGTQIYMILMGLGYGSMPSKWRLNVVTLEDGTLQTQAGETSGERDAYTDMFYNPVQMKRIEPEDVPVMTAADAYGELPKLTLTGEETDEELYAWLDGEWQFVPHGFYNSLYYDILTIDSSYGGVTFRSYETGDEAYGFIDLLHALHDGDRIADLMEMVIYSGTGAYEEDFSGSVSTHFTINMVRLCGLDMIYLKESGNGEPTKITTVLFGEDMATADGGYIFVRSHKPAVPFEEAEAESLRDVRKDAEFYGLLWEFGGNYAYVQPLTEERFTEEFGGTTLSLMTFFPEAYHATSYRAELEGYAVTQGSCGYIGVYRFTTDADGVITSMTQVVPYGGDMTGYYEQD